MSTSCQLRQPRRKSRTKIGRRVSRVYQFESLESRELLAADIAMVVTLNQGILHLKGTPMDDTIHVYQQGNQIVAESQNGCGVQSFHFDLADVQQLRIEGGPGNDALFNLTSISSRISGDLGNDLIVGGGGEDTMRGDAADDIQHDPTQDDISVDGETTSLVELPLADVPSSDGTYSGYVADYFFHEFEETHMQDHGTEHGDSLGDEPLVNKHDWRNAAASVADALVESLNSDGEIYLDSYQTSGATSGTWGSAEGEADVKFLGAEGSTSADLDFSDGKVSVTARGKAFLVNATVSGSVQSETIQIGGVDIRGSARGSANAFVGAEGEATARINTDGASLEANTFAGVKASAEGETSANLGGLEAGVGGAAETTAGADAAAALSASKDGLKANVAAFAGSKASAAGSANLGGLGVNGTSEAWAGVGIEAEADLTFQDGKLKFDFGVGASLGVGGKAGFGFTIDVEQVGEDLESAVDEVSTFGEDAATEIEAAANRAAREIEAEARRIAAEAEAQARLVQEQLEAEASRIAQEAERLALQIQREAEAAAAAAARTAQQAAAAAARAVSSAASSVVSWFSSWW